MVTWAIEERRTESCLRVLTENSFSSVTLVWVISVNVTRALQLLISVAEREDLRVREDTKIKKSK